MNTKPKEKPLLDPLKLLESLHSIHINFIKDNLPFDKLFSNLLDILLSLTGSEYGFIGRVLKNEKQEKYLKTYAITDISWNEETTKFYKEKAPDGLEFHNLETLFGWVIKNEKNLITNDAPNHPEASGIPHGHPPLDKFMGIAIKFENKMVGMVGMANRKDGYNERLLRELEPFLSSCSTLINSKIVSEEISAIENKLERFKIALDESALVSITDLKGTITYINNKFVEVSGYSYDELMGQNHRIVNSGYHPREFFVDMWKTIASGKIWNGVIKNRAKDGRFYWVSSTFIPFFDNKGKLYEYLAIRHDITQQKTAEETLAKRNAELDNFATIVSHDLKAPLRGINTMVEFIEDDIPDLSDDVKENFDMLKSRVRRLNGFIDGLLEYSRIGRIDVILEQVDFKNLLELTIDNLSLNEDVEININSTLP
ncbi:MAG: GAF domain-containing protein, partial [Cyclobacteriaceae bacterium]|nr:GAF domain-containing protein [Cyclobacteriaceae bacterium]